MKRVCVMPTEDGRWGVYEDLTRIESFCIDAKRWGLKTALRNLWIDLVHKEYLDETHD